MRGRGRGLEEKRTEGSCLAEAGVGVDRGAWGLWEEVERQVVGEGCVGVYVLGGGWGGVQIGDKPGDQRGRAPERWRTPRTRPLVG